MLKPRISVILILILAVILSSFYITSQHSQEVGGPVYLYLPLPVKIMQCASIPCLPQSVIDGTCQCAHSLLWVGIFFSLLIWIGVYLTLSFLIWIIFDRRKSNNN